MSRKESQPVFAEVYVLVGKTHPPTHRSFPDRIFMLLSCFKKAWKHHIQNYRPVTICFPMHTDKWPLNHISCSSPALSAPVLEGSEFGASCFLTVTRLIT